MARAPLELKNRDVWMEGTYKSHPIMLKNARVSEGFSKLTESTVEFFSTDKTVDLQDILGSTIHLGQKLLDGERFFTGTCVSVEYLGLYQDCDHFVAELRPWLWFLTRTKESRIFQNKTAVEIITEILGDYGFSSDLEKSSLSGTYLSREYCVQYRETDYAFICRLMEEEGIYFYFKQADKVLKMVLADSISAHKPTPDGPDLDFKFPEKGSYRRKDDHVFDWVQGARARSGKVTLLDYNFTKSTAELKEVKNIAKGKYAQKSKEIYDYPGHLRTPEIGDQFARVKMEAEAVQHLLSRGECNIRSISVGDTFKLKDHPRVKATEEHLITAATHHLRIDDDYVEEDTKKPVMGPPLDQSGVFDSNDSKDTYRCVFDVIPKSEPFRAPQVTPWPEISGMQTAVVTGPSGDEIYTDEYGRIKVQFHWDRKGTKNEETTCWVRVVMPWSGKNWGMFSIPRIGQEVAIQFEEGDPDRPICTGMLYNDQNMPPYAMPDNMTQTGIVTRSSKTGSKDTFNELVFEDKKDDEFVRLQSEKNYKETIKNDAVITIGMEKQDPGDLTQTIYHTKTETIKTGDHIFTVEKGNQEIFIKTNHTETIEGTSDQTITGNTTQTIKTGNLTRTVETGNETHTIETGIYKQVVETGDVVRTIKKGNDTHVVKKGNLEQTVSEGDVTREVSKGDENMTVSLGDYNIDATAGTVAITAGTKISLTVGANSIVIDQSGVTIDGMAVTITGTATADLSSPMTTVSADGILTLDGGTTMIN